MMKVFSGQNRSMSFPNTAHSSSPMLIGKSVPFNTRCGPPELNNPRCQTSEVSATWLNAFTTRLKLSDRMILLSTVDGHYFSRVNIPDFSKYLT